ncbi:acyl carrier protein [Pseudomonas asplenii]|uniref:acyl carrier protein n=1 Tax=Pseudomonas asplenii TaxID=53407 RepID=UPI0003631137|nr:acyl carrier protein [Pseudomonas fuscovaginae]
MNRSEIHQKICHSIEQQLSLKWLQDPSLAEERSYSLDIAALFQDLESQFHVQLDLKRDLRGINTIEDLSRFIYARTRAA